MAGESAREQVAAQLQADNPAWTVHEYPYTPTSVAKGAVILSVYRTELVPADEPIYLRHNLTVNVYVSKTAGAAAEDEADDALDAALLSLQRLDGVQFDQAQRSIFAESITGYEITAHVLSENVYRQTIEEERRA